MTSETQQERRGKFQFESFSLLVKEGQANRTKAEFARDAVVSPTTIHNCFKKSKAKKIIESNIIRIASACENIDINDLMIAAGYKDDEEKYDISHYLQKNKIDLEKERQIEKNKKKYKKFMKNIPTSNKIKFDPIKFSNSLSKVFNISYRDRPKKNNLGEYPKWYVTYKDKIKNIEDKTTVSKACFLEYLKGDTSKTITRENILELSMIMPNRYKNEDFSILFKAAGYVADDTIEPIVQDKEKKIPHPLGDIKEGDSEMFKKDLFKEQECQQAKLDTVEKETEEEVKEETKKEVKDITEDIQTKLDYVDSLTYLEKSNILIKRILVNNPIKYDVMLSFCAKKQFSKSDLKANIYEKLYIHRTENIMLLFNDSESYEFIIDNFTNVVKEKITLVLFDYNCFKLIEIKSIN